MRLTYLGLFLAYFSLLALPAFSQGTTTGTDPYEGLHKDVKKAYEAFDTEKYSTAIDLLKEAFGEVKGRDMKSEILFKIAECYRLTLKYKNAAKNYKKSDKLGYKDPIVKLHYANMLKAQGEYEEALDAFKEYKKANPTDPLGDIGIESSKAASEWKKTPNLYQVSNMKEINSDKMDFSPRYGGKAKENSVLLFTSSREGATGGDEDEWTGEPFVDIFMTNTERKRSRRRGASNDDYILDESKKNWSTPILLEEEEIVNTEHDEGSVTLDSRKKRLFFNKCMHDDKLEMNCGIWVSEVVGTSWKAPEQVIFGGDTSAHVGHPALSPDDKRMYFMSTDFGANGNRDIFVSNYDRKRRKWGTPKNLGPQVNTELNELYPFAHDNNYLYFSSDGHAGMGGLDLFRIELGKNGLPKPGAKAENLKAPINSSGDDFSIVFEPGNDKKGFMASNREGSKGDDIYSVFKTPVVFMLQGVITSSKTGQTIEAVSVTLEGGGASIEGIADKDGIYTFDETKIKKDVAYHLSFNKDKYLNNQGDITTVGIPMTAFDYLPSETKFQHTITFNIALDPIDVPIVLPNVLFETARAALKPESRKALDTVVYILKNNPRITIELRSHTDYVGKAKSNDALSQRRADSCVAYLVKSGIDIERLTAVGRGENEPRTIPEKYDGFANEKFKAGTVLSENYLKGLSAEDLSAGNQINRRTDMKVLRDDYIPKEGLKKVIAVNPDDVLNRKANEKPEPGEIYIVKGRESIGVIARKKKIKIQILKKLNGGLRGVRPFEGMQLKVDPKGNYEEWDATHYKIAKKGETFKSIAKKLGLDKKTLAELNPDLKKADLLPGLWIITE